MEPLNWFKANIRRESPPDGVLRGFNSDGVVLARVGGRLPADAIDPRTVDACGLEGLLVQLEDDGMAIAQDDTTVVPWDQLFALLEDPAYVGSADLLALPARVTWVPSLKSFGSLADRDFGIIVADWQDPSGGRLRDVRVCGAIAQSGQELRLLSRPVWETLARVARFQTRADTERDDVSQRSQWAQIRRLAIAGGVRLDGFLFKNVILTPEKLDIGLRKSETGGMRVVEVIPSFAGAPPDWVEHFDARKDVPARYDIPTREGIVQILITPQVKTVLESIKRLSGRRVAGVRAEAFLINPFAALGEAAAATIDEAQFLDARVQAGLTFERFVAHIERDAVEYPVRVGIRIESTGTVGVSEVRLFADDEELEQFIGDVVSSLSAGRQLCGWQGYDFELLGETSQEVESLKQALQTRRKPRVLVSYASIYDLSIYSSRIEDIGTEKTYYSPFIAKKNDDDGWFPDNVVPVISWTPEGETEPVAVPITAEARQQLKSKIAEARANGRDSFTLKGFDKPMPISEAEAILRAFAQADEDIGNHTFDPERHQQRLGLSAQRHLVIKANIQSIDYEEARRDILRDAPISPALPAAMRAHVTLKDHQRSGVAWLQHLYGNAPHHCRGAVLADDMGLGKTLQLLILLAWAFEQDSSLPPALVVAPVSLLENWEEESSKFLTRGALPMLTAYGDVLAELRVPRQAIDEQLRSEGLVKFLRPGWRGDAKVVLTTYETLRDLEFSFAAEKWSIMVCDEAQRIKNPNALVTRAAKKQNAMFRIACTGTPVENTLADLWCLFDYIQPGLLGALNDFGRRYRRPIEAETEEERARVKELRERISPQILRRTKAEVAKDLPPKKEVPSRIPLSGNQRSLYAHAIELFKQRSQSDAMTPFKNHLGLLHYLRLICTDPRRIGFTVFRPEPMTEYQARAPKLAWLIAELREIEAKGEKAIIFCEFREIQRMLRHYIEEAFGFAPDIINGDTSASAKHVASRQKRIKAFQAKPGFGVIILSPVAVGFGLNIQEANHVIHYTRTWNPAKEDQATDRAYRIGQTREVHVYCPIVCADDFTTFDVKLDQLLRIKRALAEDMLNGAGDVAPRDFAVEDVVPGAGDPEFSARVTIEDALRMKWDYFECLIAAVWQKKGFRTVYRTPQHDDGVDVVAITAQVGVLLQCKSCGTDESALGWDAIKEVVAGSAAYQERHPGVAFKRVCVTNQFFNNTAKGHAERNDVELVNQTRLASLLEEFLVRMIDVERFLYSEWGQ